MKYKIKIIKGIGLGLIGIALNLGIIEHPFRLLTLFAGLILFTIKEN